MSLVKDLAGLGAQTAGDARRLAGQVSGLAKLRVLAHPDEAFGLLRDVRPVFIHGDVAVVSRFPDVVEVLTHDAEFSVSGYAAPMQEITGDFILGLDEGPAYERSSSLLRLAFRQSDLDVVAALARQAARDCIAAARPARRIDVVADLTDRVPARLVAKYLGVPGPDEDTLIRWARSLFTHIFVDLAHDRILTEQATAAAQAIRPHLDGLVAARQAEHGAGVHLPDDVLTRLVKQQALPDGAFTDEEIRSNLIGLLVGMIPTISKASALAINELLSRPEELEGARAASRGGDRARFSRYVLEAMRFAPQAPGLLRVATTDYPIARGTPHETVIRKGTKVFASTQSAMMDRDVVEHPHEFRLDRPDSCYLHYGAGLHACFGRYLNLAVIAIITEAVLDLDGATRAPGRARKLTFDGTWPSHMTLEMR